MTKEEMVSCFEEYSHSEYLKFENEPRKLHHRRDIHAFLMLDILCPSTYNMIGCAEHDEIYLETSTEEFSRVCTEENILSLVRCGVSFVKEYDCFRMFV